MTHSHHSLRLATSNEDLAETATSTVPRNARRGAFLKWLRKMHSWIGLWGAALGLLFGITGILQNHRAIMKIPAAQSQESVRQIALPEPTPISAEAMAQWLQTELAIDRPAIRVRSESSKTVAWGDKAVQQPARWSAMFSSPRTNIQTEYWVGNNFVSVKRSENNVFGILNNLHKGAGVDIGWILLADTLGGGIILLSVTGVALWAGLNKRRIAGAGIGIVSLGCTIALAMQSM